jgi:hypothetical protein
MTVIDSITNYALAGLSAIPTLTDPDAVELEPAGDPDIFPSLGVMITDAAPIERECTLTRWKMGLTVEGFVENGTGEQASQDRTALHAAAVAALMADDRFGGLIELIEPEGFRFVTAELASKRRLAFVQDFSIEFTTSRTNPALPA